MSKEKDCIRSSIVRSTIEHLDHATNGCPETAIKALSLAATHYMMRANTTDVEIGADKFTIRIQLNLKPQHVEIKFNEKDIH